MFRFSPSMGCCAAFLIALSSQAQQKSSRVKHQSGAISGRVFLITGSGDLKIARMAKVYLMWSGRNFDDDDARSVGSKFYKEFMAPIDASSAKGSAQDLCMEILVKYDRALKNTLDWSFATKNSNQIRIVHTDEDEGRFKVAGLRPGIYSVVARGQAGFNEAVWQEPLVEVKPAAVVNVKLSKTEFSCLSTN